MTQLTFESLRAELGLTDEQLERLVWELAQKRILDPERLKRGKARCWGCRGITAAYHKGMDKRLAKVAYEILGWLGRERVRLFKPFEVFQGNERKDADARKLQFFGLTVKVKEHPGYWRFTEKGHAFLNNEVRIPKGVWVYKGVLQTGAEWECDEWITVARADPRWEQVRADFALNRVVVRSLAEVEHP